MAIISLIVAADEKNAIGKDNKLPWRLPADLRHFKAITMGHPIIMGRKTFESLGRQLPGRRMIVVSRNPNYMVPPSISIVSSLPTALFEGQKSDQEEIFVIGGAQIFREALPKADRIYLTRIHHTFEADTFMPEIKMDDYEITEQSSFQADEKNKYPYTFYTLNKKKPEAAA